MASRWLRRALRCFSEEVNSYVQVHMEANLGDFHTTSLIACRSCLFGVVGRHERHSTNFNTWICHTMLQPELNTCIVLYMCGLRQTTASMKV